MSGLNKDEKAKKGFWFQLRKIWRSKLFSNSISCCYLGKNDKFGVCFMCFRKNPDEDFAVSNRSRNFCCSGNQVESLRIVMEKNDFFSQECNTHFDLGTVSGSSG